jgi:hypothetical protein
VPVVGEEACAGESLTNVKQQVVVEPTHYEDEDDKSRESSCEDALAAVAAAKKDLLKHSLEMMVKQGLMTTAAATGLNERALRGDALMDAAIDSYAADGNVTEFMETLQILAINSPEDVDNIMQRAMADEGEKDVEDVVESSGGLLNRGDQKTIMDILVK